MYLGLAHGDVINYAIRSALINIEGFDDFKETASHFTNAAMTVLGMEDADEIMHYYGLPETQSFPHDVRAAGRADPGPGGSQDVRTS